jgi:predicted lipoprotein with Yx(FWY)xxD motif
MRPVFVRLAVAAALTSGLTLTAACAGPGEPVTEPSTRQLTPATAAGLFVVEARTLGPIVVDGQGFVLYRFDGDSANPPTSTCAGSCATEWLPVPAADDLRIVGIDRQLVGRLTRTDGTAQLTLAGWPLYGYAGDRRPGDTNGHDSDPRWYVIGPNGARVAATQA